MPNNIQTIIKDWEKLCDNDSELNSVRRQVATILKDYLTSMLDGIKKELPEARTAIYANASYPVDNETKIMCEYQKGLNEGEKNYRQEVINIINSHR